MPILWRIQSRSQFGAVNRSQVYSYYISCSFAQTEVLWEFQDARLPHCAAEVETMENVQRQMLRLQMVVKFTLSCSKLWKPTNLVVVCPFDFFWFCLSPTHAYPRWPRFGLEIIHGGSVDVFHEATIQWSFEKHWNQHVFDHVKQGILWVVSSWT